MLVRVWEPKWKVDVIVHRPDRESDVIQPNECLNHTANRRTKRWKKKREKKKNQSLIDQWKLLNNSCAIRSRDVMGKFVTKFPVLSSWDWYTWSMPTSLSLGLSLSQTSKRLLETSSKRTKKNKKRKVFFRLLLWWFLLVQAMSGSFFDEEVRWLCNYTKKSPFNETIGDWVRLTRDGRSNLEQNI